MEVIPQFWTPIPYLLTLSFVATYAALHLILLVPLQKYMAERDHTIESARKEADDLTKQIEDRLTRIDGKLQEARAEVADLRSGARAKAAEAEARIQADARARADVEIDKAVAEIEASRGRAATLLRTTSAELSGEIARTVLGRTAEPDMRTFLLFFLLTVPAFAADPHAEDPHDDHGDAHHVDWTGDADHDGTPNWRDPKTGEEPNEHYMLDDLGAHLFNLALILGVIVDMARRPVGDALKARAHDIRKAITDAARARDEARQRHDELGARLASFEDEVAKMKAKAAEEARQEEERLIERAHAEAERIAQAAKRTIRDEVTRAQLTLRKDAVDLAVQLAEQTLRAEVGADDQKRLARQFLDSIGKDKGVNGHG